MTSAPRSPIQAAEFAAGDNDAEVDDPQPLEGTVELFAVPGWPPGRPASGPRRGLRAERVCGNRCADRRRRNTRSGRRRAPRGRVRRRQSRPPPGNDPTPRSAPATARRRSARRAPARRITNAFMVWSANNCSTSCADLWPGGESRGDHVVFGVLEFLGLPHPPPQPVPLSRRHHADPYVAVLARVDRVGVLVSRAAAPPIGSADTRSGLPMRPEGRVQRHHNSVEPGEVDVIASATT